MTDSTNTPVVEDEELQDYFGGTGGGAPVITFVNLPIGAEFTGIIVPADVFSPDVAYVTGKQRNTKNEVLYWPMKPGETKRRPRPQAEITLITDYRKREFMSKKAVERAIEREQEDDGLRRWFVKGESADKRFKEALRVNRRREPEVGATVTVIKTGTEPNAHGGDTNLWGVKYEPPTAATRKIVQDYIETALSTPEGADSGGSEDEPPF
jgi:hypothetical protein